MHFSLTTPSVYIKSTVLTKNPPVHPKFSKSQATISYGERVTLIAPSEWIQKRSLSIPVEENAQHAPQNSWSRTWPTQPGHFSLESKFFGSASLPTIILFDDWSLCESFAEKYFPAWAKLPKKLLIKFPLSSTPRYPSLLFNYSTGISCKWFSFTSLGVHVVALALISSTISYLTGCLIPSLKDVEETNVEVINKRRKVW